MVVCFLMRLPPPDPRRHCTTGLVTLAARALGARLVACRPFWTPWTQALGAWIAPCDAKTNLVVLFGSPQR
jgi:hypothetical protein